MPVSPNIALLYPRLASLSEAALEARVNLAQEWIKQTIGRDLDSGSKTERLSGRNRPVLWLKNTPVASITSVTLDGSVLASSDYVFTTSGKLTRSRQGFVSQMCGWEPGVENVVVVYQSSGIPSIALDDMTGAVASWMLDVARVSGVLSSERIGNYQFVANTAFNTRIPPSVMAKLSPYMRVVS